MAVYKPLIGNNRAMYRMAHLLSFEWLTSAYPAKDLAHWTERSMRRLVIYWPPYSF